MYHGYEASVGSGDHVDHFVWLRQFFFQYDHRERRSTCRYVAGALLDGVGCYHAGACVSFRRADRYSCLQMTGCIELFTAFRCEDTGIFTSRQYFGQNVFQFPTVFFRSNQIVEFGHHFGGIVVGSRIYGEHTRCVTNAQHLFACYLPMYITCKSCQELDVFDVRFVVQNSLVQMRNAPSQRDVIDK